MLFICEKCNQVTHIHLSVLGGLMAKQYSIHDCDTTEKAVNAGLDQLKRQKQGSPNGTNRDVSCLKDNDLNPFRK